VGPQGAIGATGAQGTTGPSGAAGATGAQGIVATVVNEGNATLATTPCGTFSYIGPPSVVTVSGSQHLTGTGNFNVLAGPGTRTIVDLCTGPVGGAPTNFLGVAGYAVDQTGTTSGYINATATGSVVLAGGTYNVGLCSYISCGAQPTAQGDFKYWVQVTN